MYSQNKAIYLTLVRSQLMYCTPIWHPYLLKDIQNIERIQRCATKFILTDYDSNYKTRLLTLKLLPLMYLFELQNIIFTVKSLKSPTKGFNISFISHSAHLTHGHLLVINLNIFPIPIILTDFHSFTDYLNSGMPFPLLIYIFLYPLLNLDLNNIYGIIL